MVEEEKPAECEWGESSEAVCRRGICVGGGSVLGAVIKLELGISALRNRKE